MSYVETAKRNRANAEKAQAFDNLQQRSRETQLYDAGAKDAYTDVERALIQRAQQNAMQQQIYSAARKQQFANQDVRGPASTQAPVLPAPRANVESEGLAASVQNGLRENAYANALIQAQQDGNLSDDYINQLVEKELSKVGGL